MAGLLQPQVRAARSEVSSGPAGSTSYGPNSVPGPGHGDLVLPTGAALGGDQAVPAVVPVDVRALGDPGRRCR